METTVREPVEVFFPEPTNLEFDIPSQAKNLWNDDPLGAEDDYYDEMEEKFQPIVSLTETEELPLSEENSLNSVVQLDDSARSPVPANSTEEEMNLAEHLVRIKDEIVDKSYEIFKPHDYNFKVENDSCEEEVLEYRVEPFDDPIHDNNHRSEDCDIVNSELIDFENEPQKGSLEPHDNGSKLITNLKSSIQNRFRKLSFPKTQSDTLPLSTTVDKMPLMVPPMVCKEVISDGPNPSRLKNSSTNTKAFTSSNIVMEPQSRSNPSRLESSSTSIKSSTISTIDIIPKREQVPIDTFTVNTIGPNPSRLENSSTGTNFPTINFIDMEPKRKENVVDTFTVTTIEPNPSGSENPYTSTKFPTEPKREEVATDTFASKGDDLSSDIETSMKIPFTRQICEKRFLQMDDFISHVQQHKTESNLKPQSFSCNFCRKKYRMRGCLVKHIAEVHKHKAKLKKPFTCNKCDKGFFEEIDLISHELEHELDARLIAIGEEHFSQTESLEVHMNMMNPVGKKAYGMNFVCKRCTRRFNRKLELLEHMQIHNSSPELIHTCNLCRYQFATIKGLRLHHTFLHKNNPNDQLPFNV